MINKIKKKKEGIAPAPKVFFPEAPEKIEDIIKKPAPAPAPEPEKPLIERIPKGYPKRSIEFLPNSVKYQIGDKKYELSKGEWAGLEGIKSRTAGGDVTPLVEEIALEEEIQKAYLSKLRSDAITKEIQRRYFKESPEVKQTQETLAEIELPEKLSETEEEEEGINIPFVPAGIQGLLPTATESAKRAARGAAYITTGLLLGQALSGTGVSMGRVGSAAGGYYVWTQTERMSTEIANKRATGAMDNINMLIENARRGQDPIMLSAKWKEQIDIISEAKGQLKLKSQTSFDAFITDAMPPLIAIETFEEMLPELNYRFREAIVVSAKLPPEQTQQILLEQ